MPPSTTPTPKKQFSSSRIDSSDQFSWIHLSDVHLKGKSEWDSDKVLSGVIQNLEELHSKGFYPDAIFFTGDAAFGNLNDDPIDIQFEKFGLFLDRVRKSFVPVLPKTSIYIVPGNHDVDRSEVTVAATKLLQSSALSLEEIEDHLNNNSKDAIQWFTRHNAYRKFITDYGLDHLNPNEPTLIWKLGLTKGKMKISISGLNSSWSCCGKNEKGKLRMGGRWQLGKLSSHEEADLRIVLLHHPSSWLDETEEPNFGRQLLSSFDLVFHGHEHQPFVAPGTDSGLVVSAGACFDTNQLPKAFSYGEAGLPKRGSISFRQWDEIGGGWVKQCFANFAPDGVYQYSIGSPVQGTDTGKNGFESPRTELGSSENDPINHDAALRVLRENFRNTATCYSSYQGIWVDRVLAAVPESTTEDAVMIPSCDLQLEADNVIIQSLTNFGLSCLARQRCLDLYEKKGRKILFLRGDFKPHPAAVKAALDNEIKLYGWKAEDVDTIILDNCDFDKNTKRKMQSLKSLNENWKIVRLITRDDTGGFKNISSEESETDSTCENLFLWSLSKQDIRKLVNKCASQEHVLSPEELTDKIVADLEALNIHRTPLNVFTLLKISENLVDDTPVNRTEMIKRVLSLLFNQFNQIPRYTDRPDLVDCENALGFFAEYLIKKQNYAFSRDQFIREIDSFSEAQLLPIDSYLLFTFLCSEQILVKRSSGFEFRFSYWLYYFSAHRMHHSESFRQYVLEEGRYIYFPEVVEFYSGLDRRRADAVKIMIRDLKKLNQDFVERSKIENSFNPYDHSEWHPTEEGVAKLTQEIEQEAEKTSLSHEVRDAMDDKTYDRSKAYDQKIEQFIEESSLPELFQAIRGATRTLRNSDYVDVILRKELLKYVMISWKHVTQTLFLISPILAVEGRATFNGMGFILKDFQDTDPKKQLHSILSAIPWNLVRWFEDDIHSKKLGPLLINHLKHSDEPISNMLLRRVIVTHQPEGWQTEIERFIASAPKNSVYLLDCFKILRSQYKLTEAGNSGALRRVAAITLAKHNTGISKPNQKLIKKGEQDFDNRVNKKT